MNEPTLHSAIPGAILHKLWLVRRRKMLVHAASAAVAALAVLLLAMGVAMLVDWLATLYDSRWRFVLTAVALATAGVTTAGWLLVARRRSLGWDRVAGDVDQQFPLLEERWTTMTQLPPDDARNPQLVHPAMLRRVATEAACWEPYVQPEQVVSLSPLVRTMIALTAVTAVLAVALVLDARQTFILMRRFWMPGASISATELVDVPGDVVVGRGEPLALAASVRGTSVERAILLLRDDDHAAERALSLVARGQDPIEFAHRLRSVERPFEYRFRAGDGQTAWYRVAVAERPEIEKLVLTLTPPTYTGRPAKSFDRLPPQVAAIERTELELAVRPTMPIARAVLPLGKDNSGKDRTAEMTPAADGWFRWRTTLTEGLTLAPVLTESHGLANRRAPKCRVTVYPDRPPAVKVLTPDDQMEVRPEDTIEVTFTAQDDVGIGSAELLIYDEASVAESGEAPMPLRTIPIPLEEQAGARSVQKAVQLDLKELGFEDGSEFSYEIRVREDRGGSAQEQVASTQPEGPSAKPANYPAPAPSQIAAASPAGRSASTTNSAGVTPSGGAQTQTGERSLKGMASLPRGEAPSSAKSRPDGNHRVQPVASLPSGLPQSPNAVESPPTIAPRESAPRAGDAKPEVEPKPNDSAAQVASHNDASPSDSAATAPPGTNGSPTDTKVTSENERRPAGTLPDPSRTAQQVTKQESGQGSQSATPLDQASEARRSERNSPAAPESAGVRMPKPSSEAATQQASSEPGPGRTATTGRQSLSSRGEKAKGVKEALDHQQPSSPAPGPTSNRTQTANHAKSPQNFNDGDRAASQAAMNQSTRGDRQQAPQSQESPSAGQTAAGVRSMSATEGSQPPSDPMARRSLDVAQESSSKRMRLKVDQWAGSFEGQQRSKAELAIAPELVSLDRALARAERTARGVLDDAGRSGTWQGRHDRDVSSAERATVEGQQVITRLQQKSKDTPYAFIGLQVADIGLAQVNPARSDFWKALQSDGGDRVGSVRDAAQHLARAREMIAELKGQFERAKREFQLAESVDRVKKMYRVYLENSQALLRTEDSDPQRYNRKRVEFELDDDYLARLREVMEMRRDMRAELARILADDPRLLRRYMDSLKNRAHSLREDLAKVVAEQEDLNREVRAWTLVDDSDRPRMAKILSLRQAQDAGKLASSAGELQSRYQAWLPLDRESKDAELAAASKQVQRVATAANELEACCQAQIAAAQRPAAQATPTGDNPQAGGAAKAEPPVGGGTNASGSDAAKPQQAVDVAPMIAKGEALYHELNNLEVALRQLAAREQGAETAGFAANRLVETRRMVADTSAWVRQMRAHQAGAYSRAAEVDQYRLAMKTDELAGKLGSIEQSLAALMQRNDGRVPQPIAEKARQFLSTLDTQASPNQLAGVYALRSDQMSRAVERQRVAGQALARAEKQYDELIRLAIQELDKLPVQDPIAQLLEDPTLDELLAELERESPVFELLGIPQRPSNLQIVDDWLRGGGDNSVAMGGGRMTWNQLRQDQRRTERRLDQAYQRAIARALKEIRPMRPIVAPQTVTLSDWNQLVSKLGDDLRQGRDKAPPEQYRRAIEQYFSLISRVVAEQQEQTER